MSRFGRPTFAIAAALLALTGPVFAAPVTYTFSGTLTATDCTLCDTTDDTLLSGAFTFVVNADTSSIDTSNPPFFRLNNVDGLFTLGSFVRTLTGVTVESNATAGDPGENIDFFSADFLNGLGLSDPALAGYDLSTSIGPITVSVDPPGSFLTPTFVDGGHFSTTGEDSLTLTGNDSLTFLAQVQGVPEPITLSLFGAGLAGAAALRRRRKKSV